MRDSAPRSHSSRKRRHISTGEIVGNAAIALLPVLACFLGGGTQKWAEGIVLTVLGFCLLIRPPRASLGAATNFIFVALIALAAIAFLPARWFFLPVWRNAMVNDFTIFLPPPLPTPPRVTVGGLLRLIIGL